MSNWDLMRDAQQQEGPPGECRHGWPEEVCAKEGLCKIEELCGEIRERDSDIAHLEDLVAAYRHVVDAAKALRAAYSKCTWNAQKDGVTVASAVNDLFAALDEVEASE